VWELASTKDTDSTASKLLQIKMQMTKRLKHLKENGSHYNGWEHDKLALGLVVETLEWLQTRLGRLKICENSKCHGRKYFFKVYNNDRYCCIRCGEKAKALRQTKRDAELQKPPKVSKFSEETRKKMADSAAKRWDKYRAKAGTLKYQRSQRPVPHAR
jgi:hypothetical protein